jgi:hypothetical protein
MVEAAGPVRNRTIVIPAQPMLIIIGWCNPLT